MEQSLVEAVQQEVAVGLSKIAPVFGRSDEPLPTAFGLYVAELSLELRAYIMFQAHRSEDSFTIEVACTKNGRWPANYLRRPPAFDQLSPSGDVRFRLALFWGAEDHWWQVISATGVETAVADALERLQRYALPYFDTMAEG